MNNTFYVRQGWRFRREKPVFPGRVGKTWEISVFPGKIRLKWEKLGNLVGKSVRFLNFSFVFHVSVSMLSVQEIETVLTQHSLLGV